MGYVGEISYVNIDFIKVILKSGYILMMVLVGFYSNDGFDHVGNPLNINGDTVVGEVVRVLLVE